MRRRGLTLIEIMVGVAVGSIIIVAALSLAVYSARIQHRQSSNLQVSRGLRDAAELIAEDVRNAGVGVGYDASGVFGGFALGADASPFAPSGRTVTSRDGSLPTDDLVIRRALGRRRSALGQLAGEVELCVGLGVEAGDLISIVAKNGLSATAYRVQSLHASTCALGVCVEGCEAAALTPTSLVPGGALVRSGDAFADLDVVAWFVVPPGDDPDHPGGLRRATQAQFGACAQAFDCGGLVSDVVTMLQVRYARFDEGLSSWVELDPAQPIRTRERLRVDLELFGRSRTDPGLGQAYGLVSELVSETCAPSPCGTEPGSVPRAAYRTTVEVRNAGRLRIQ